MISRETENVKSSEEIESAFRALSTEAKPYVTKEELYQVTIWLHTSHPCSSPQFIIQSVCGWVSNIFNIFETHI